MNTQPFDQMVECSFTNELSSCGFESRCCRLNNNLVWKLQLRYVGLYVELSISSSNGLVVVFAMMIASIDIVFLLDDIFYFPCKLRSMFHVE